MPKFHYSLVILIYLAVADKIEDKCIRFEMAGSMRRREEMVGDLEILYIPKPGEDPVAEMVEAGFLTYRLDKAGRRTFGRWNKYLIHRGANVPIDFFQSTEENWGRDLLIRTGPKLFNLKVMGRLQKMGMSGHASPSSHAVTNRKGEKVNVATEDEFFRILGWNYIQPHLRK